MAQKILDGTSSKPTALQEGNPLDQIAAAKEQKDIVAWVKSNYEASKGDRQRYERQWALNMAFYRGRQYMQYYPNNSNTPLAGKLFTPPSPSWSARSITNRIRPIIRTEMARLTSNKPNASVVPSSTEDADLFAAEAAEQVWEAHYSEKKLHRVFSTSAFWLTICGTSFLKIWWSDNEFDCVSNQNGSIEYAAVTPFHIYVSDLYEPEIEKQPWVINAYTKSVEWVKTVFGITVNPSVIESKNPFDQTMLNLAVGTNEAKPDSVLVIECWIKPNVHPSFPQGGLATVVDDQLVVDERQWPYQNYEYPFIKLDHIDTGMFYSESVITDLIPLQREYNRTRNQIIDAKNRMSKPQLMAPKGSVDAKKITTEPGLLIEYRPGLDPPKPLPLQPIPSYVLNELGTIISDMEDISSQHQVSRGETPAGVTAATAISFMQERDDSLMTTAYSSVEAGWEKLAKLTIGLVVQFWDVPRTVSVTGDTGYFDSLVLQGDELKTGTRFKVESGSALPTSKAAKQAFLLDLMKMGMIDPNKGLELMEMGGMDKLYDEIKIDERQAQRENLRLARTDIAEIEKHVQMAMQQKQIMKSMQEQGAPVDQSGAQLSGPIDPMTGDLLEMPMNILPVNTWDNHQMHIEVHNRFRKSQAYEKLSEQHKQQFELHVQMHAMALNQAAEAAMMLQPPGEGGLGAENGSGTPIDSPVGSNQFGPPGTEDGAPPPEMMME